MISIVTTAINRPDIIEITIRSVLANSNLSSCDLEWLVNIDFVPQLENAEAEFDKAVSLCQSFRKHFPVTVLPQKQGGGPAAALRRMRDRIRGDFVFYLEDDWVCKPEKDLPLDFSYFASRLSKYSYCTLAGRLERCSFNPCLMRKKNFQLVTDCLELQVDAEMQAQRRWMIQASKNSQEWLFDPDNRKFFHDIGREWIKKTPLEKWDMKTRYQVPITYNIRGLERK